MADDGSKNPCLNKGVRTAAQQKIASVLLCEIYPVANPRKISVIQKDEHGRVLVDIRTRDVTDTGTKSAELGGEVVYRSERYHAIHAYLPLDALEKLAETPAVRSIHPTALATTNHR